MTPRRVKDHVDHVLEQWAQELPGLDASPMAVLGRVSRLAGLTEREFDAVFSRFGINGGEFDVLASLRRSGPPFRLTPTELAKSLMVSSGGMTKRLKALEAAGLVRRVPSPTDGRSSDVVLTAAGKRVVEDAVAAHRANEERMLVSLAPREREALAGLLRRLLVELGDGLD
jgi:DNA-binding MarR family transcriptional regulator